MCDNTRRRVILYIYIYTRLEKKEKNEGGEEEGGKKKGSAIMLYFCVCMCKSTAVHTHTG